MKFALNGALTIGADGANIEIKEESVTKIYLSWFNRSGSKLNDRKL